MRAYVLIQVGTGEVLAHRAAIARVDGVVAVSAVVGPYDAIGLVEADTLDGLERITVEGIQAVAGVTRTITCPVRGSGTAIETSHRMTRRTPTEPPATAQTA
ncbi:Lrp/AsnC ligand binding domain-containing protein [Actinomadura syzygii]|uniref:Lrp/AsnC ligand binding domain-containing protein n=1 Tax=Actinomadura syzygii TaxID=1427538 RepID=UPI001CA34CD5|nr:Lrp/AsnC ligand binding domain-containing protein [Actinomadura syzygii]